MGSECGVVGFNKGLVMLLGNRPRPTNEQLSFTRSFQILVVHYSQLTVNTTLFNCNFYICSSFCNDFSVLVAFENVREAVLTAGRLLRIKYYIFGRKRSRKAAKLLRLGYILLTKKMTTHPTVTVMEN